MRTSIQTLMAALLMLCMGVAAQAAGISASVDRQVLYDGESLTLTLESNGSTDGRPDFTPLEKDFEILTRNKSSSMQFINGKMSSKVQWILTLLPKHKGKLSIPAIAFGHDLSNALIVVVKDAPTSTAGTSTDDVFMQVSAEPKQAWVQAQIIYTVKIYVAVNIGNASLSEPKLSDADAVVERLGEDKRYETLHMGRRYQVIERQYAIFPQQSGKLKIDPLVFSAQIVRSSSRFMDPFNQFGQSKRLQSRAIEIDIKAVPSGQQARTWLPAAKLSLQEAWPQEPPRFKVGEAVTRTLTLSADGLTAAQLPEIAKGEPDGFKAYPDQAKLEDQKLAEGIHGQRTEKVALIATAAGDYTLPEISINWWNTQTQRAEVARLPARKITVLAAEGSPKPKPATVPAIKQPQIASAPPSSDRHTTVIPVTDNSSYWPWLSLILGLGWLGTLALLWYQARQRKTHRSAALPAADTTHLPSLKQAEQQIKQACLSNDALACKTALLGWARVRYPHLAMTSLTELGKHLEQDVAEHLMRLNKILYSPSTEHWQGNDLWQAWCTATNEKGNSRQKAAPALADLYP